MIVETNSPLNNTKNNARVLGHRIEEQITSMIYDGCAPGQVDFLSIVAALTTILNATVLKVPKQHRRAMIDNAVKVLMQAREKDDSLRVRMPGHRQ